MGSCYGCKNLLNCGACKACGTNFDRYEPMDCCHEEESKIEDLEWNSKAPRCPVCGEEMKFVADTGYWHCIDRKSHAILGPVGDHTGEKTRAMIAKIRQEERIADLEAKIFNLETVSEFQENRINELEEEANEVGLKTRELESIAEKIKRDLPEFYLFLCQECKSVCSNNFAEVGGVWSDEAPIICPTCAEKIGWFCDCGVAENFVLNGEKCHSCGRIRSEMEAKNGNV